MKELKFKERFISGLLSIIVSSILALHLALNDFGVWALVIQNISFSITKTIISILYTHGFQSLFLTLNPLEMFSYERI